MRGRNPGKRDTFIKSMSSSFNTSSHFSPNLHIQTRDFIPASSHFFESPREETSHLVGGPFVPALDLRSHRESNNINSGSRKCLESPIILTDYS